MFSGLRPLGPHPPDIATNAALRALMDGVTQGLAALGVRKATLRFVAPGRSGEEKLLVVQSSPYFLRIIVDSDQETLKLKVKKEGKLLHVWCHRTSQPRGKCNIHEVFAVLQSLNKKSLIGMLDAPKDDFERQLVGVKFSFDAKRYSSVARSKER